MDIQMRQKILKELKSLLNEQEDDIEQTSFMRGNNSKLSMANRIVKGDIKLTPEQAADYINGTNENIYINVDEARAAYLALKGIKTPDDARKFVVRWKEISKKPIALRDDAFNEEGSKYKAAILKMSSKITDMAGISDSTSVGSGVKSDNGALKQVASASPDATQVPSMGKKGISFKCKDTASVVKMQKWLVKNGAKISVDGEFGPRTLTAYAKIATGQDPTKLAKLSENPNFRAKVCAYAASPKAPWSKENGNIPVAKKPVAKPPVQKPEITTSKVQSKSPEGTNLKNQEAALQESKSLNERRNARSEMLYEEMMRLNGNK